MPSFDNQNLNTQQIFEKNISKGYFKNNFK